MCGILGIVVHDGVAELREPLISGLRAVEYRGYDSSGVAVLKPNGAAAAAGSDCSQAARAAESPGSMDVWKRAGKIAVLEQYLGNDPLAGSAGLGHTRWATHGEPNDRNSHPHQDWCGRIAVVHNGIIENYAELKAELIDKGIGFRSGTDTEVAANLIGYLYDGDLASAVRRAALRLKGSFSLCVIALDQPRLMVGIRHKMPLLIGHGTNATYLASDATAFLAFTREVTYLDDGEMAVISGADVQFVDFQTGETVEKPRERLDWSVEQAQKGGFDTFMLKEIHEQPEMLRRMLERHLPSPTQPVSLPGLEEFAAERETRLISLVGCGTAYHACKVGKYVLEGLARTPCRIQYAHEAQYHQAPLDEHVVTVAVSQSGETADTLGAVRAQQAAGSRVLAVCNVVGSSLTRVADLTLYTMAGPEISVASTKAFTCQIGILFLMALWIAERNGAVPEHELSRLKEELLLMPGKMAAVLEHSGELESLARVYRQGHHFYYLGRGISYPVALEGALKLKEISYVHAEGYAGGEMKHGAIALIEPGFPSCILAPHSPLLEKMVGNMEEILSRKGEVMVVTNAPERFADYDVHTFAFPECPQVLSPLLMVIPLQLFAYYSAALRGCDIDQPRNLAKSVVVE
jgi:glucosamine--fructose-6-phosphate aminotransferase (isomerizing)